MEFEWDETKRQLNLAKHGIDFRLARLLFDGRPVVTTRNVFPREERYLTTGIIANLFVTVVWTRRVTAIRVISVRRAAHAEQRIFRSLHGGGT